MDTYFNSVGLVGVLMMLVAYFLLQTGKVSPHNTRYLWLNLIGALAVLLSLLHAWNLPSFVIEAAWALISLFSLLKPKRNEP